MIAIILLMMPFAVIGGTVKKWVDREGVVHFGDSAPVDITVEPASIKPLTGGKGLSSRQMKLFQEFKKRDKASQEAKFKAENRAAKQYKAEQKIESAYRSGRLVKGMGEERVRRLLGQPDRIDLKETKSGILQKWHYEDVKPGRPETVYLENGAYRSHRNKKAKK